jgi:murein tripeptide amidase MpaA
MKITSNFDSGNISVLNAETPQQIELEINKDNQSDFYQWFHFKLSSSAGEEHNFSIKNAKDAAYPEGWVDYQVMASYDRETWFRINTQYENGELTFQHIPEFDHVFYAYFVPFSYERHLDLIHKSQQMPDTQLINLGETIDGRDMSMLKIGSDAEGKKNIWIIV